MHWPSSSAEDCRRGAVHQRLLRHLELTERHRCSLRVSDLNNSRIRNIGRTACDGATQLGGAQGGATWSADGKLALAFGGVSGTAVTYMQPMSVISTTTGRQGLLLPNRIEGVPLAGPGGWILYARYDPGMLVERHGHRSDHVVYVLDGEITVGEVVAKPGTNIVLEEGAVFGPIEAGPQGALLWRMTFTPL